MAGTITRSGAGLIKITGGTNGAPVTPADLYAASVAGGWGTVSQAGTSYYVNDHLLIGDGSTATYFKMTDSTVQVGSSAARKGFCVAAGATLQLGNLSSGYGRDGALLVLYLDNVLAATVSAFSPVAPGDQRGTLKIYGSRLVLTFTNAGFDDFAITGAQDWVDSSVGATNGVIYLHANATGTVLRSIPAVTSWLYFYTPNVTLNQVPVAQLPVGILCGSDARITGSDFTGKQLQRYYGARVTLTDCIITDSAIISSSPTSPDQWVYQYFTYSIQCVYGASAVSGASVSLNDSIGVSYSGATDASGASTAATVLCKKMNWDASNVLTTVDVTAKTLRVRKYGYRFVETAQNLTAKTIMPVSLLADVASLPAKATAQAITTVSSLLDLYAVSRLYFETNISTASEFATLSSGVMDFGAYNVVFDTAAAAVFSVAGSTVTVKSAASVASSSDVVSLKTTGAVTIDSGTSPAFTWADSAGTHVTISAPGLPSGARVQIYNTTDGTEVYNGVLSGSGLSLPVTWSANKTIRLRATKLGQLPLEAAGVLASSGLAFLSAMSADAVYTANAVDGAAVTEFAPDPPNLHVDITDGDGITSPQRLYAWMQYYLTTSSGVSSGFFGGLTAADSANYAIDPARVNLKLDNQSASPVLIVGGYLYRTDGTTVIAATSGSIQMDPGRAYTAPGSAAITVPAGERVITMQPGGGWVAHG